MKYLFVAVSDDRESAEYALGNERATVIESGSLEDAIKAYRREIENRADVEEFGELPANPYKSDYSSSIDHVFCYPFKEEFVMPVSGWADEVAQEISDVEAVEKRKQDEKEFNRLKAELGR